MATIQQHLFLARPSLRRVFFYTLVYIGLILFGIARTDFDPSFSPVWQLSVAILAVLLTFAFLKRWTTLYTIDESEIQSRSGIFSRDLRVVPMFRVTNATAHQSFLERLLGLMNVKIDTAGAEADEIVFTRILKAQAGEVARIIREHTERHAGQEHPQVQRVH